jgi:SHS2 domain-containing protein
VVKNYQIIEHTADLALCIRGEDLPGLFTNAALALFEISAVKIPSSKTPKKESISITQKADTLDELFINWLNELLSLSATRELVFTDFKISKINENNLEATATGEDLNCYKINREIKAATYSGLKIEHTGSSWQAEVILDV